MIKLKILLFTTLVLYSNFVFSSAVLLLDGGIKENQKKVFKTLNKIGKLNAIDETGGFQTAYSSPFFNNFNYNLYFGNYSEKKDEKTILRIESSKEDTRIIKELLLADIFKKKYKRSYTSKSHIINQFLNILSPGFSYMYGSYESARRDGMSGLSGGAALLALDFSLYYLSVRRFFFDGRNPWSVSTIKTNYLWLAATMGSFRLITAFTGFLYISGHNDLVTLGYKFSF